MPVCPDKVLAWSVGQILQAGRAKRVRASVP
eukprot:CAMPEP_0175758030 /NCGR_PEP_ID=MMETSP0097-20121207/64791_1 /TAXON_ID=311494 /ORGANISM="Alexandrium monilatum, Strain CCMP3105" /LENGTH=30 /DNA_ID= /DNA_START= /DNA_END= /DNA_ORIENTATION=